MRGASRCAPAARAISPPPRGPCRACTSDAVIRSIGVTATDTSIRKERRRYLPTHKCWGLHAAPLMTLCADAIRYCGLKTSPRFETVNALPDLVASDDVRPTQ